LLILCTLFVRATLALILLASGVSARAEPGPSAPLPAGWVRLADLPLPLARFGAAALPGRIVVAGGYDTQHTVLMYDIAANRWTAGPPLLRGTDNVAVLAAGGRVLVLGGEAGRVFQILDPAQGSWTRGPDLPGVRFASAAAVLADRVHLVGGWNADNRASASLASHAVFDPEHRRWVSAAAMAVARNAAAAAVIDGRLYVAGGRAPGIRAHDQHSLNVMEVYDPAADRWASAPPLPSGRAGLALVALAGQLYALGGESTPGGVGNAVERYDPATQTWSVLPPMPIRSHGLAAVAVGASIYVMGGFQGASDAIDTASAALYRYTPTP
jgi:N-acetylneuraminic acid mutarotase